jgi:hypothetical protein
MISDFLSATECSGLIAACEHAGFENLDRTFPQTYRKSDRLMIFSQRLAHSLFTRLLPHFKQADFEGIIPIGFGRSGKWIPVRLNECLKVVKYTRGGKIIPHQDGPWVPFEDQASAFTLVVYLNDDFEGGETLFLPDAELGSRQMISYKYNAESQVKPSRGSAIVFDHRFPHAGAPVSEGTKYILRAEVVFQRVYGSELASPTTDACLHYTANPKYLAARALYDESRLHELHGDKEEFVSKYQEVLRLQCEATAEAESALQAIRKLRNDTIWVLSLQWLGPKDLLSAMQVDKAMLDVCSRMEIWQPLVLRRWPAAGTHRTTLTPLPPTHCVDWRSVYRLRLHHSDSFSSLVVFVAPDHIRIASPKEFHVAVFIESFIRPCFTSRIFDGIGEYNIAVIPTAISSMMRSEYLVHSFPVHMNLPDFVRFNPVGVLEDGVFVPESPQPDDNVNQWLRAESHSSMSYVLEGGEAVNWPTCAAVVRMFSGLQPSQAVLLVAGPKGFVRRTERHRVSGKYMNDRESFSYGMLNDMCYVFPTDEAIFSFQHVLCSPAVRVEHVAVAALAAIGYSFGVVLSVLCPSVKSSPNSKLFRVYVTIVVAGGLVVVNEEVYSSPEFVSDNICREVRSCVDAFNSQMMNVENKRGDPPVNSTLECKSFQPESGAVNIVPTTALVMGLDKIEARSLESEAATVLRSLSGGPLGSLSEDVFKFPLCAFNVSRIDGKGGAADACMWCPVHLMNAGVVTSEDILRGGALLSTHADHRSKCIFQPFI